MKYLMRWTPELVVAVLVIVITGTMLWCGIDSEIHTIFIAGCTLALRAGFGLKKDITNDRRNKTDNNPQKDYGIPRYPSEP